MTGNVAVSVKDSGWFIPVERENLQDLLTERKIVRALESPEDKSRAVARIGPLTPASVIIEGGIVAYDSNVRTGGAGVAYLGISASQQYRVDQVTIYLRAVDIRSGQILNNVSTTKTIYSYQVSAGVYRFIGFKDLLQAEAGLTSNEPQQLCVKEAIEAGVVHLVVDGLSNQSWELKNSEDMKSAVVRKYLQENANYLSTIPDLGTQQPPRAAAGEVIQGG